MVGIERMLEIYRINNYVILFIYMNYIVESKKLEFNIIFIL